MNRSSSCTRRSAWTSTIRASPRQRIAREFLRLEQVAEPQSPDAELRGDRTVGVRVERLEAAQAEPGA